MCRRVTVLVWCVCLSVCLSVCYHASGDLISFNLPYDPHELYEECDIAIYMEGATIVLLVTTGYSDA